MKRLLYLLAIGLAACMARASSPVTEINSNKSALTGKNIALWQSHGRYYDVSEDRWKWQRCRLFGTVEDLYTRSYVVPLLVPMLENAGATVWLPRERDSSTFEVVIDDDGGYAFDGYSEHNGKNKWHSSGNPGFGMPNERLDDGDNPFRMGSSRSVKSVKAGGKLSSARWSAPIDTDGEYAVYISYPKTTKAVKDAHYTVHTATGDREFLVDQSMGAGTWVYLGTFPFSGSKAAHERVTLTNESATDGIVGADAVRIGGGMGSVMRGTDGDKHVSGMPRWAEAARYWLQYAGMPADVYASEENDYRDDIFCRPQWVNYLKQELNVPVDLTMAFHSDAGSLGGDSIVGTLGIYFTDKKRGKFADGSSRTSSERLAKAIVGSVVDDIRELYDINWTQRKMKDAKYIEARIPETPTMLLELLSHQNLADMRYGLDPQFKFDVARAVYKGMLRFLSVDGSVDYIVQPLAPESLSLTSVGSDDYLLSWKPRLDPLESTAVADSYIIEVREGSDSQKPFSVLTETTATSALVKIPAGKICSYRIIARNKGGYSFASEVMAAGHPVHSKGEVRVVNGFTRTSAPDLFIAGNMAGFGVPSGGVAYGTDLSGTGAQYNFDRSAPWVHDDQPGFGASRANMETIPVYGNSFDNVILHGVAIMSAGYSFDSQSVSAFVEDSAAPRIVDMILGLQKETKIGAGQRPAAHSVFPAELKDRIVQLAAIGSRFIVSGSYVASDCDDNEFLRSNLGIGLRSANATAVGRVNEVKSRYSSDFSGGKFTYSDESGERPYAVTSPDAIIPVSPGAETIMRYDENQSPAAAAYVSSTHKTVTFGFPLEAIDSMAQRKKLMNQILDFLK